MSRTTRIHWINAVGLLLALFGYAFAPWQGAKSGLALLVELGDFLGASAPGATIGRQQAIFAILLGILFCLLVQAAALTMRMRTGRRGYLYQEIIFALLTLVLFVLLIVAYQAQTIGVLLTLAASSISGLAALIAYLREAAQPLPESAPAPVIVPDPGPPSAPAPVPAVEPALPADPMLAFQRQVARHFHQARSDGKPFTLGMVGIRYYDEVVDAFGDDAAQEILGQLARFVATTAPQSVTTTFSTGAVMMGLPGLDRSGVAHILATISVRMDNHGFPGEMLLPEGHIHLVNHAVSFPDDGDNLARLTEELLSGYAEKLST